MVLPDDRLRYDSYNKRGDFVEHDKFTFPNHPRVRVRNQQHST